MPFLGMVFKLSWNLDSVSLDIASQEMGLLCGGRGKGNDRKLPSPELSRVSARLSRISAFIGANLVY